MWPLPRALQSCLNTSFSISLHGAQAAHNIASVNWVKQVQAIERFAADWGEGLLVVEALDGADVGADKRDLGGGVGVRVAAVDEPPPAPALFLVAAAAVLERRVQEEGRAGGDQQWGLDVSIRIRRAAATDAEAILLGVPRRHRLGHSAAPALLRRCRHSAEALGLTSRWEVVLAGFLVTTEQKGQTPGPGTEQIVMDVRLPVGSRIGGSHMDVTVAINVPRGPPGSETGHGRVRVRVTDPPMATCRSTARSRGAGQDLAVALPSESCVAPRRASGSDSSGHGICAGPFVSFGFIR